MVDPVFAQCNYCKTKLLLRFQMGYFDIPFDICCPDCGVHIHGLRKIVHEHSTTVNNASIIDCELGDVDYYAYLYQLVEKSARLKELNILLNMDQKDRSLLDDVPEEDAVEKPKSRGYER